MREVVVDAGAIGLSICVCEDVADVINAVDTV